MSVPKKGIHILSYCLIIMAFFFSFSFPAFCLGDSILSHMGLPAWSEQGFHITILYSVAFLFTAIYLLKRTSH